MKYVFFFLFLLLLLPLAAFAFPFLSFPFSYLGGKKSEGERTAAGVGSSLD